MNIFISTGSLYKQASGPYESVRKTAQSLSNAGAKVVLIGTRDTWRLSAPAPLANVSIKALGKIGGTAHFSPLLPLWLLRTNTRPDVVSLQSLWLVNNAILARWCRARKIPYVISIRGNLNAVALGISTGKKRFARSILFSKMLAHAGCIHALNDEEYRAIRQYGLSNPVCIIPNGVDVPDVPIRQSDSSQPNRRTCLYLGRLHPIKGLEDLLGAWARLPVSLTSQAWKLVLAGQGEPEYTRKLETLVKELGIAASVSFAGPRFGDAKAKMFQSADCFVYPSHSEGLPMAPLEAMAYGLPALLTSACNLQQTQQVSAAIVVPFGQKDILTGLTQMLTMPNDDLRSMGRAARKFMLENYQWDSVARRFLDVYAWLSGCSAMPDTVRLD